jgi:hypothetical protein
MYVIVIEIERLSLQIVATASLEEEDEDGQRGMVVGQGNAHGDVGAELGS